MTFTIAAGMPAKEPASRRIQAVDRAAALLRAVAEAPAPVPLAQLADAVGLNRSTAWRLLLTLEHHHLVDRDPEGGGFVLGYEVGRLAMRGGNLGLVRHLRPTLSALSRQTSMASVLAAPTPTEPIAVDQVDPPGRPEPNMVGWGMPLHATAAGKLWLAFLDERERDEILRQPLPRFTDATVVDPERLRSELHEVRQTLRAFACDEWDAGWSAVASPVLRNGSVVAMLSVMATTMRFTETREAACRSVRAAADDAARLLSPGQCAVMSQ